MSKRECGICEVGQMHTCGMQTISSDNSAVILSLQSRLAEVERERDNYLEQLGQEHSDLEACSHALESAEAQIATLRRELEEAKRDLAVAEDQATQALEYGEHWKLTVDAANRALEKVKLEHTRRAGFFRGALEGIRINLEHGEVSFVLKQIPKLLASPEMEPLRPDPVPEKHDHSNIIACTCGYVDPKIEQPADRAKGE